MTRSAAFPSAALPLHLLFLFALRSSSRTTASGSLPPPLSARAQGKQACRENDAESSGLFASSRRSWAEAAGEVLSNWRSPTSSPSSSSTPFDRLADWFPAPFHRGPALAAALDLPGWTTGDAPSSSTAPRSPSSLLRDLLEPILRAVPKKKVSHSRKSMRSANKGLKDRVDIVHCPGCGRAKLHHHLCEHCYSSINRRQKAELRDQAQAQ
ncbi:hypothetical protein V8E36_003409 [Tilletia maclaganii]